MVQDRICIVDCLDAKDIVSSGGRGNNIAYRFLPNDPDDHYYRERTDRNIGWITREEQAMIHGAVIGVAACGGMGGEIAEKFLRLGVGELRIADNEVFDTSNINRQFAAARGSVGCSKAARTAQLLRDITDDTTLLVYPQGICEESVLRFVCGCDIVCDEIELWCVGARILLHRIARAVDIPIVVCNTVGFGSHLFLFTPRSTTVEECLGMDYGEACVVQERFAKGELSEEETMRFMEAVTRGLCVEWPEYCSAGSAVKNRDLTRARLLHEKCAATIATNPPFACGFLADRVLLHLLRNSSVKRRVVAIPEMPGYCYLDAATMTAKVVKGKWW
jgi:molybdopterin/thiamine biosynthesis adenylyltransferase